MSLIKSHYKVDNPRFKRIQRWVWICIYAGLLLLVVSHFVQPMDAALAGWGFWLGLPLVAVGCVLIYVRSRMEE
jgi:Na+-transporting NADH:ubiquinone oxidoreductase subunit NqrB